MTATSCTGGTTLPNPDLMAAPQESVHRSVTFVPMGRYCNDTPQFQILCIVIIIDEFEGVRGGWSLRVRRLLLPNTQGRISLVS